MNGYLILAFSLYLQQSLRTALSIAIPLFMVARLIFFEIPFYLPEDLLIFTKTYFVTWVMLLFLHVLFLVFLHSCRFIKSMHMRHRFPIRQVSYGLLVFAVVRLLIACGNTMVSGFYVNAHTGLKTTYTGIKTVQTDMVMNEELLNHTDIPIGESFQLINRGVQGLIVKDDKVHIACSLQIQDAADSIIFQVPDLFEGRGYFHKDSASVLRCTINTGLPMKWEEQYRVNVVFSDQQGKGKIENTVTIRAIDIP